LFDAYNDRWVLLTGIAVALKFLAAAWVCRAVLRRRLAEPRFIAILVGSWAVVAGCFFTLLYLANNQPGSVVAGPSVAGLAFVAALLVPLTRILLTPLAIEWNRRR
jgi:hypothetical protein